MTTSHSYSRTRRRVNSRKATPLRRFDAKHLWERRKHVIKQMRDKAASLKQSFVEQQDAFLSCVPCMSILPHRPRRRISSGSYRSSLYALIARTRYRTSISIRLWRRQLYDRLHSVLQQPQAPTPQRSDRRPASYRLPMDRSAFSLRGSSTTTTSWSNTKQGTSVCDRVKRAKAVPKSTK